MAELPEDGERTTQLKNLRNVLDECMAFDVDALLQGIQARAMPASFDFLFPLRELFPCLDLCRRLGAYEVEAFRPMPRVHFANASAAAHGTIEALKNLAAFRLTGAGNDLAIFQQITHPLGNNTSSWFQSLTLALAYLRREDVDLRKEVQALERQRRATDHTRAETEKTLKDLEADMDMRLSAVDKALQAAQQAALLEGVRKEGRDFRFAQQSHAKEGRHWALGAAVAASLIVAGCLWVYFCPQSPPLPDKSWMVAANLSYFGVRVLLVSVLSFVMVVCVRNYRGARHNEVMNAHRARALATFRNFAEGSEPAVRQAVTLHAAQAVFAVQPSAYAEPGPIGSTHFAEIAAATLDKK